MPLSDEGCKYYNCTEHVTYSIENHSMHVGKKPEGIAFMARYIANDWFKNHRKEGLKIENSLKFPKATISIDDKLSRSFGYVIRPLNAEEMISLTKQVLDLIKKK